MESPEPTVSIIIPTYNRPALLSRCLKSLAELDYPTARLEVIVVDDGSSSDLEDVVQPYRTRLNLKLLRQMNLGPGAARNAGAQIASHEVLAFTDDDCIVAKNWLGRLVEQVGSNYLVGGEVQNALIRNLYSEASQFVTEHLYEYYSNNVTGLRFFTTNNMAILATEFHALAGFSALEFPSASEDRDFCDRWQNAGKKLIYEPKARVFHSHDLNMRTFWRQHMNYGTGGHAFHAKRRKTRQVEIRVEKLNFYSRLLSRPFCKERPNALSISTLIMLSQIANAVGFFQAFYRKTLSGKVADFDTLPVRLSQEA